MDDQQAGPSGMPRDEGATSPDRGLPPPADQPREGDGPRVPSWLITSSAWSWRLLLLVVGGAAVLLLLARLYLITLPVIVSLILTTLCVPPARALERRRVPRMLSASLVVLGGLAVVSGVIAVLVPVFVDEMGELAETAREGIDRIYVFLETNFGWDQDAVADLFNDALASLQQQSGQLAQQALTGAAIAVQAITALLLVVVLLFFFVKDGAQIVDWAIARTPPHYRATVRAVGRRGWIALAGFVRGTAAIALVDAVGIGVGLAIVGVPAVLPISVLVFLGAFIPVIGAFVTGLLAVLVALAAGGLQTALVVLAIVVGVQQIESNVLQPVIMRRAVALHPVVILAALTAGASTLGLVGAFLAVPVAAVTAAMANELRLHHEAGMVSQPPEAADTAEMLGAPGFGAGPADGAAVIAEKNGNE